MSVYKDPVGQYFATLKKWNSAINDYESVIGMKRKRSEKRKEKPSRKKLKFSMRFAGGRNHGLPGVYTGRFPGRGRRIKRVKWPVIYKQEVAVATTTANANACLYLIHTTHPLRKLVTVIAMSILHKYYQMQKFWISNWDERAGIETGTPAAPGIVSPDLGIYFILQRRSSGTTDSAPTIVYVFRTTDLTPPFTWKEMADKLADGLINSVTTASEDYYVAKIQFRAPLSSTGTVEDSQMWDGPDTFITVSGKSVLTVQNRTNSGDASGEITSNEVNPLRGKEYFLRGSAARIRDFNYTNSLVSSPQLVASSSSGEEIKASNGLESDAATNALQQPPPGNYFYNCIGQKYVMLQPGELKKSVCKVVIKKTLNQWLNAMFAHLHTATTVATIRDSADSSLGVSKMIALEKLANMGSASVAAGAERNGIMMGKCFIRKRHFTVPYNDAP